jgi:hypothetical protein
MKSPDGYDRHHSLWTRKEYDKLYDPYLLRNHPVMIHTIPREEHEALHRTIGRPQIISQELAKYALEFLWVQQPKVDRFERFINLTDRLDLLSRRMGALALEAGYFTEHFDAQIPFLENRVV